MAELSKLAQDYANQIIASDDFQRLLILKEKIEKELTKEIVAFKNSEAKYLEAKSYGIYHPNLNEYQLKFKAAKQTLYANPLVKEYFELERKIQKKLNADLDMLKASVSNKFLLNKNNF